MSDGPSRGRREFLKAAGIFVAAAACAPTRGDSDQRAANAEPVEHHPRTTGFDAALLASLGAAVLPASLGTAGQSGSLTGSTHGSLSAAAHHSCHAGSAITASIYASETGPTSIV